jgi:mono/diheme cytochrome c family protein
MDTQEKGKAYRTSDVFPDGRTMRDPVPGTVARGWLRDDDHLELGLGPDGQPAVKLPDAMKTEAVLAGLPERGRNRYQVYCAPCHGRDLDGQGPVALRPDPVAKLLVPPPNLVTGRVKEDLKNGDIYAAIANGVRNMPAYGAQIPVADRWAIVAFLRKAQGFDAPYEPAPGAAVVLTAGASAQNGAALYKSKGCNACHTVDGNKLVGPTFKGLAGKTESTDKGDVVVDEAYFKESVLQPMAKIVAGFPPAMPPQVLTDDEIKSLWLYLETLK